MLANIRSAKPIWCQKRRGQAVRRRSGTRRAPDELLGRSCAFPYVYVSPGGAVRAHAGDVRQATVGERVAQPELGAAAALRRQRDLLLRSEERRVGEEGRSWW